MTSRHDTSVLRWLVAAAFMPTMAVGIPIATLPARIAVEQTELVAAHV